MNDQKKNVSKRAIEICLSVYNNSAEIDSEIFIKMVQKTDEILEVIQWMSGSADFGSGGQAEAGFNRIVRPILTGEEFVEKAKERNETLITDSSQGHTNV